MRSKRRRQKRTSDARHERQHEREKRKAAYLERLTPEQMAAYEAERDYVAYRAENKPVRYPRPPRSPGAAQAR